MSAPPDLSAELVGLRAYAEGLQAICAVSDGELQITSYSLARLLDPVLRAVAEMEAALGTQAGAPHRGRAYTPNH